MKRSSTFTSAAIAAALIALPAAGLAQTPPATGSQPPASAQAPATTTGTQGAAKEHLAKASAALDEVTTDTLSAAAKKQVAELKRRINTLERTVSANDKASATGAEQRAPRATAGSRGAANWGTEVAAIDKTLTAMLGPDATAPAPTGTTGAAKGKAATALDDVTKAKLTEVRTHITAFATAMAGGTPVKKDDSPQADPGAATPATPAATPATPQPAGSTATPPEPATPATQTPPPGAAPAQAAPQADEQAARRHLTEARNTLSALTQLPAASQLSGDARTQVSQLISNFNELISAQSNWKESYDKVSANLSTLLGPENVEPAPPATGTPGAVGTSGTVTVDPSIREKLVELRRQLSEFEKAAGGSAAADPSAMATPPASAPTTATPPAGAPPAATPPSTTPPSATPPTGAPETTPAAQAPAGSQPAAGNADVMRHIAAIEALLKSEDDSGGLTLTKAQVEQLRTHWAALKAAIR